ncbi:MAG: hypothetical protein P4M09_21950 [Devosia sp.]|nr:hypothetical protein [Devosia sp.]
MPKFTLKTYRIPTSDQEFFEVRGLSFNDVTQLVMLHRETIERIFATFSGRDPNSISEADASDVILSMIDSAPALVAHIVALGADDLANFDEYVKLPMGAQVEAIEKIGELTFATGGGPKKLFGLAMKLVGQGKTRMSPAT